MNIISELDKTIKRLYPGKIPEFQVVSQFLELRYQNEIKTGEIGIRKVNGAGTFGIIKMFLQEFISLLIIAFIIAAPLACYIMSIWLQNFACKIRFDLLILTEAGFLALILVLITVIRNLTDRLHRK